MTIFRTYHRPQRYSKLSTAISAIWIASHAPGAQALACSSFVIHNGEAVTKAQCLSDGQTGEIQSGGSLSTVGIAVLAGGAGNVVTNIGSITTSGSSGYGIYSTSTGANVTNSGSITTAGLSGHGIVSIGADANITNSGSISTTGDLSRGILSSGTNAKITNSGSISTTGLSGHGIVSFGTGTNITNSGSITTTGSSGYGIWVVDADATISNSGSISTTGVSGHGIVSYGTGTNITNSGSITAAGTTAHGIWARGADATINNSGFISVTGSGAYAIYSDWATDQTLNILPGSRIRGRIDLGDDGMIGDTVNIYGTGGSARMTFENTEHINVFTPNAIQVGNTVLTVEPTMESSRGVQLSSLTGSIHNVISQRMQSVRPFTPIKVAALELSPGMLHQERPAMGWGQIFGSTGNRGQDGQMLGLNTSLWGVVAGYEQDYQGGRIGFLAGAAKGNADTRMSGSNTDSLFAGAYGHAFLGWANLTASVIVGGESHDQKRTVLDNLLGYQTASSDTDSVFFSPSITLSRAYKLSDTSELRPSATLSYSIAHYDGYKETGTTNADLRVGSRTVQALSARLQDEWAIAIDMGEVAIRGGIQARHTDGDTIKMNLGGNTIRFDPMGDKDAVGAYLGAGANIQIQRNLSLVADLEYSRMTGDEEQVSGQMTLQYSF